MPSSDGIFPLRRLSLRSSITRADSSPNSDGIPPGSRFPERSSRSRLERLPSTGGTTPPSPPKGSRTSVTRSGVPPNVMPLQSCMGVASDQFNVLLPARVSLACSSASQSDTSPGLLTGSCTAVPAVQSLAEPLSEAAVSCTASQLATTAAASMISATAIARPLTPLPDIAVS